MAAACMALAGSAQASTTHYFYDGLGRFTGLTTQTSQVVSHRFDAADNRKLYQLQQVLSVASGDTLYAGQEVFQDQPLISADGHYVLYLQQNGLLLLLHDGSEAWRAPASASTGATLQLWTDGNLYLLDPGWNQLWTIYTSAANRLVVQNDGNLVLYTSSGAAAWDRYTGLH